MGAERVVDTGQGYGADPGARRHLRPDATVVALAVTTVGAVWLRPPPIAVVAAAVAVGLVARRRAALVGVFAVALCLGSVRSDDAWAAVRPRHLGPFNGWARVVGDPFVSGAGVRVTLEIDGERFDAWVYGSSRRRLVGHEAGEWVQVDGHRRPLGENPRRAEVRHVVGRFDVDYVADSAPGSAVDRSSARVRSALRRSAEETMAADEAALFTGLVLGDDSRQPPALVQAFRDAGMSHLTAVSGQNLAYALAVAGPLLRRLRPWWRWATSVAVVAWFMALTRFEPSVLRAGVMAMLAATTFVLGGRASPVRLLATAVALLVLVDPLLVWSVGFWLSVGATAGVGALGPPLGRVLPGPSWVRLPLGVTLGAQLGVAVPSLLVFHRLPLLSIPANLLAVPIAGFVMLYGLPAASLADLVHPVRPLVMWPVAAATRWVEEVALLAARLSPPPAAQVVGWLAIGVALVVIVLRSWVRAPVPG